MCYLDIIQGVLTLKFYSAPEPNLPLQQLQLVPTLLSPQHPPPLTSVNFTSLFIILRSLSQINENIWQTDPTQVIQYYCFNVSLYFSSNTILTSLYISPSIQYLHCCVWDTSIIPGNLSGEGVKGRGEGLWEIGFIGRWDNKRGVNQSTKVTGFTVHHALSTALGLLTPMTIKSRRGRTKGGEEKEIEGEE